MQTLFGLKRRFISVILVERKRHNELALWLPVLWQSSSFLQQGWAQASFCTCHSQALFLTHPVTGFWPGRTVLHHIKYMQSNASSLATNYLRPQYLSYSCQHRPPLSSSGQSYWLQIQRFRVRFPVYHIFCEVVGLERGPLSLVSTVEELTE
jgi:hypothetical protein